MTRSVDLRLYAVLDPERCGGREPVALAAAAARGGITQLQLRDKLSETRDFVTLARQVHECLRTFSVPLIINDRVDVALAVGAEGAHVGRTDMTAADARWMLGAKAIVGATVHHLDDTDGLISDIVDYLGLGPVFLTQSKDPGDPPLGAAGLRRLIDQVRHRLGKIPCCGIAGIDQANAASVIEAGADGVAVISDIFMADDVETAARRLRRVVDDALTVEIAI